MSTFSSKYPPPTSNTMDPAQRTRLVRTARKLEALLGTTPQLIDLDHHGRLSNKSNVVYGSPFSSSASSLDSTSSENHSSLQHERPSELPSSSQARAKVLIATEERKPKKPKGPQPLAQPLLLRMSAVPVGNHCRQPSLTGSSKSVHHRPAKPVPAPIHPTPAPPLVTPSERRKLKVDSVLGPLSPINKSHFPLYQKCHQDLDYPPSSVSQDSETLTTGLSDREKRIKMAKLQRIMGANVPQELVFRENPSQGGRKEKSLRRRSRSMSALRPGMTTTTTTTFSSIPEEPMEGKFQKRGKQTDAAGTSRPLPTVPISRTPSRSLPPTPSGSHPSPIVTQTITTTSSRLIFQPSSSMQRRSRKHRPRSLSLGTSSAIVAADIRLAKQEKEDAPAATRGAVSLDEGRDWIAPIKSTKMLDRPDAPFVQTREHEINSLAVFKTEIWRRKEREWSGEWNIKDVEQLARSLRSLRVAA